MLLIDCLVDWQIKHTRFVCVLSFSDINSVPLFKNLPQTVSIIEGVSTGSTVFQPQVDDKDLSNSHIFSVVYSPPEGVTAWFVGEGDKLLIYDLPVYLFIITLLTFFIEMLQYEWLWSDHMIIKEMFYIPIKLKPELARGVWKRGPKHFLYEAR
jgi:hypothetical protein